MPVDIRLVVHRCLHSSFFGMYTLNCPSESSSPKTSYRDQSQQKGASTPLPLKTHPVLLVSRPTVCEWLPHTAGVEQAVGLG